jgi:hypothetical protein
MAVLAVICGMAVVSCIAPVGFEDESSSLIATSTTEYETTVHVSWAGVSVENPAREISREVIWEGNDQEIISDFDDPYSYYFGHFTEMAVALGMLLGRTNSGTRIVPQGFRDGIETDLITGLVHNPDYTNSEIGYGGHPVTLTITGDTGTEELVSCPNYRIYVDTFRRDKFNKALITVKKYIAQFQAGGKVFTEIDGKYPSLATGLMVPMVKQFGNDVDTPGVTRAITWRTGFGTPMTMQADLNGNPVSYYEGLGSVWFGSTRGPCSN